MVLPWRRRRQPTPVFLPGKFQGASLMAQQVKNLPAMQETWVQSLGRSPGGGNGNPLQYSCPENSMDRGAWWVQSMGGNKLGMTEHAHIYTSCHVSKMLSRKRASAYRIIKCTQTFMFMYCYSYFTDTKPLLHIYLHFVFFHCNRWALGFKWKSSTFYRKKR